MSHKQRKGKGKYLEFKWEIQTHLRVGLLYVLGNQVRILYWKLGLHSSIDTKIYNLIEKNISLNLFTIWFVILQLWWRHSLQ